jgi:hypothetical protein
LEVFHDVLEQRARGAVYSHTIAHR